MIKIDDTLVSEALLSEQFVCDLSKCKGACCIEGDSGAPLEKGEQHVIQNNLQAVKPYMNEKARSYIEKNGFHEIDEDGERVLQCIDNGPCVFAIKENNTWTCSIEKSCKAGKQPFRKPISCHLYPVRLTALSTYTGVNYHQWDICDPACDLGRNLKMPVFMFAKEALIRKFGKKWYNQLELIHVQECN